MIKNLSGDYETVEYDNQRFAMLYDNDEVEEILEMVLTDNKI